MTVLTNRNLMLSQTRPLTVRTTVLTRARTPQTTHPMGLLLRSLYKMLPVIQSKPAHDNYMALVARLMRTCLQIAARLVA